MYDGKLFQQLAAETDGGEVVFRPAALPDAQLSVSKHLQASKSSKTLQ